MKKVRIIFTILISLTVISCSGLPHHKKKSTAIRSLEEGKLIKHSDEFEKNIIKVCDNVYSAVGYGLANSILIEGDDGLIIVDTLESTESAGALFDEFRKISNKPVKAIIYTHNHVDHIMGTKAMTGGGTPDVYAHNTTDKYFQNLINIMRPIIGSRSMRMFGNYLDQEELVNSGIGPDLKMNNNSNMGYIRPTKTFSDTLETTISGVKIKLIHAPGETDDQIYVLLPEKNVLICGDNFYKSFPNLYTIRGTTFRSLENWYKSVDIIRDIRPEFLVPCHSRPLSGADTIYTTMTNYRDAIQYIHDQGIRGINQGMTADELVEYIKLPDHLASLPYLQEFYGKASWSLRSLFNGNLGWFSGDSAELQPLNRKEEARMIADLAGGTDHVLVFAKKYAENGNNQAALELSGHLLRLEPSNNEAKSIRIQALQALGRKEENANARHYYFTEALETKNGKPVVIDSKIVPEQLSQFPLDCFFASLSVNLNAQACGDMVKTIGMRFTDENSEFSIYIRRGVAEIKHGLPSEPDILVTANAKDFKAMLAKIKNPIITLAGFNYEKGNAISFGKILAMFEPSAPKLAFQSFK